jgi:Uma2 family endonuclease
MIASVPETAAVLMTAEEFLSLPENRKRSQFLIRGKLWENAMTFRNPFHSELMMKLGFLLNSWLRAAGEKRFKVVGGEAGFRLRAEPSTIVGIDVAVVSRDVGYFTQGKRVVFDGVPVLAIEILSPSDRVSDVEIKVDEYLSVGVKQVWIVSPHFQSVEVHCPNLPPVLFTGTSELSVEPDLPGMKFSVADIFES